MPNWDVIVIGGGIWGLSCAYACAKRGQSVAIFEAGKIGQGASGGIVGAMAPNVPESWNAMKLFQFNALDSAADFWAKIDAKSGLSSGYGRIGRLMPIVTERDRILSEERSQNAKDLWQGLYQWDTLENHPMLPEQIAPFGVSHDTLSARLLPYKAVASLTNACGLMGVEIFENRLVETVDTNLVAGAWGQAQSRAIIIASGAHGFTLLDKHLGCVTGTGIKGQAALLECDLGAAPQIFADGVYVIPQAGGVTSVGATSEKNWNDPYAVDEKLEAVIEAARNLHPELHNAPVIKRWAGLRPKARRRYPMLGPIPELEGVFSAMGAYTIGFGLAHSVGEVLADFAGGGSFALPKNFTVEWHLA